MAEIYDLSPDHPEFVPVEELAQIQRQNEQLLEAGYQDNCNLFRASVFHKLTQHHATHNGSGWAIFYVDGEDDPGSVSTLVRKEVLVWSYFHDASKTRGGLTIPTIRLLTNETYLMPDGPEYLASDVTLDDDNDAQYFVDATMLHSDPREKHYLDDVGLEPTAPEEPDVDENQDPILRSLAPLFIVSDEGILRLSHNFVLSTPLYLVEAKLPTGQNAACYPFGQFLCMEDRLAALTVGQNLLDEIRDLEPVYTRTTTN